MTMAFSTVAKAIAVFYLKGLARIARHHPIPSCFAVSLFFFMGVEYTLKMVPSSSPPKDIGFFLTENIHGFLSTRPGFNSFLAALNTFLQEFLSSGVDFPVGNVSFFLFFSGHVAGAVIASLDMRRMKRCELSLVFDCLNALQALRLLATRGHYTIDLAVGLAAGFFFDILAGNYEDWKSDIVPSDRSSCNCN